MDEMSAFNPEKPVCLPGRFCTYCGKDLNRRSSTKDHVVARNFVPEGTLVSGFFLQVRACRPCNDRKAALEDDISLITMLPDTAGNYARDDERLRRTVARKAKGSVSAATRRLAALSYNKIDASMPLGDGVSLTYSGIAMPSIDDQRIGRMAYYHVQGFRFFGTFNSELGRGSWIQPADFLVLGHLIEADWGNPRIRHFMTDTSAWEPICIAILADGYFRLVLRKHPTLELRSWALEWNGRLRVFGVHGEEGARDAFAAGMPKVRPDFIWGDTTNGFATRIDTPISDEDDDLFDPPRDFADRPYTAGHWK